MHQAISSRVKNAALCALITLGTVVCGQVSAAPAGAKLAADTPSATRSGATFTAPRDWSLDARSGLSVVTAPEGDLHVAIVDVSSATDAAAAVAAAWTVYRPDAHRKVELATPATARSGWDERTSFAYETSPNERAIAQALAQRKGTAWTIVIIDGAQATAEKRGAALGLILGTMRAPGYSRELFSGRVAHPLDAARIAQMSAFVQTSMQQLHIPGASFALVDHGTVVYEGGIGVKEIGKPEPVDAHTLYMIASNTKGMSTLLLAKLVDAGKLAWDEPVTKVYPSFQLGSPATTQKVLVRNLVCACTGLPRKDLDWILNTTRSTPATTSFAQLAKTEPTSGFGEVFQYNNLMASAAGYIGGHLVYPDREIGAAYDAAMQSMIFAPLGMTETTFDYARALAGNYAHPHDDTLQSVTATFPMDPNYSIAPYRPAGGAWSSAHDLIKYVQDEITQGVLPDGTRFVSAQNLLARRAPSVPIGEDATYGMGLEVDKTWGVPVVHHGGSMFGYKSDIMLVPDAQVGAVILTNSESGQALLRPFMRRLLEVMYDGKPEAAESVSAYALAAKAGAVKARELYTVPVADAIAATLAPRYTNADLGHVTVERDAQGLIFNVGLFKSHVASHKNADSTISLVTIDPGMGGFEFVVDKRDGKRALVVRDGQHEYVYIEAP